MRCLLDTNALSAFAGETSARLVERMLSTLFDEIGLSSIVVHELAFGAYRSAKVAFNLSRLEAFARVLPVLDFTTNDAASAGEPISRAGASL